MTPELLVEGLRLTTKSADHLTVAQPELTLRSWLGAAAALVAVGAALGALLLWALFASTIPKGTSVPLALIGLLPIAFFIYLGLAVAYFGVTGRRIRGAERLNTLAGRVNRPL
jgi:hypothetical protein